MNKPSPPSRYTDTEARSALEAVLVPALLTSTDTCDRVSPAVWFTVNENSPSWPLEALTATGEVTSEVGPAVTVTAA